MKIDDYKNFFEKFKVLAIKKKPPFKNDSDAGVKDAIVAYNVEILLEEIDVKEKIILVSGDSRLKEYFEKNERVRTVDNISGVEKLIKYDNGLVKKIDNKNEIGFVGIKPKTDREKKIEKMLTNLRNSISFEKTHEFIGMIKNNRQFLTNENKADIIKSALNNSQIRWIIKDQDIFDFLLSIYFDCIKLLNREEIKDFELLMGINF